MVHSRWANLETFRGMAMEQNKKSAAAREMMNMVVAWTRSLAFRKSAKMVRRFPSTPTIAKSEEATAANMQTGHGMSY